MFDLGTLLILVFGYVLGVYFLGTKLVDLMIDWFIDQF